MTQFDVHLFLPPMMHFVRSPQHNRGQVTFLQAAQNELQLGQRVDADQVGLHLLAGLLRRLPVVLL